MQNTTRPWGIPSAAVAAVLFAACGGGTIDEARSASSQTEGEHYGGNVPDLGCDTQCPDGKGDCDGSHRCLTNLDSDDANCGACGSACDAGWTCQGGQCKPPCGGADLQTDNNNCGTCGNRCCPCSQCVAGKCQPPPPCGGADLQNDNNNCGACGNKCCPGTQCTGGKCTPPPCDADLQTDPKNCGACGNVCPMGQLCVGGKCVPPQPPPACTTPPQLGDCGYPFASDMARTSVAFSESEVLRGLRVASGSVQVFYNDEHALTLGVSMVTTKSSGGTAAVAYPVSPLATNPGSITSPQTGATGDAGADVSGRPLAPSLFITDITSDPTRRSGDWQYGGTPVGPGAVFGTWKSAARTVDNTHNPATMSVTPAADPAKNNWSLGAGSDAVPPGLTNQGFGAEARWQLSALGLVSGHVYRLQVMVHDGNQNKTGGDAGEACAMVCVP